jgi:hypothetical protein
LIKVVLEFHFDGSAIGSTAPLKIFPVRTFSRGWASGAGALAWTARRASRSYGKEEKRAFFLINTYTSKNSKLY